MNHELRNPKDINKGRNHLGLLYEHLGQSITHHSFNVVETNPISNLIILISTNQQIDMVFQVSAIV